MLSSGHDRPISAVCREHRRVSIPSLRFSLSLMGFLRLLSVWINSASLGWVALKQYKVLRPITASDPIPKQGPKPSVCQGYKGTEPNPTKPHAGLSIDEMLSDHERLYRSETEQIMRHQLRAFTSLRSDQRRRTLSRRPVTFIGSIFNFPVACLIDFGLTRQTKRKPKQAVLPISPAAHRWLHGSKATAFISCR